MPAPLHTLKFLPFAILELFFYCALVVSSLYLYLLAGKKEKPLYSCFVTARIQVNGHCTAAMWPRGRPTGNITLLYMRY
jgi:hypothetical protein